MKDDTEYSASRMGHEYWAGYVSRVDQKPVTAYMCYADDGLHSSYYASNQAVRRPLLQIHPSFIEVDSIQRSQSP